MPTDAELDRAHAAARAAWPGVELAIEPFRAHVARHAAAAAGSSELRTDELYLACACATGSRAAIEAVEARMKLDLATGFARVRPAGLTVDDAGQLVRAKLFVGDGERPPKILDYGGRGDLGGWLRVLIVRTLIDAAREHHRLADERAVDDELIDAAGTADNPELDYLRRTYRVEFKLAFESALAGLPVRDRNVLRFHLVKRLTVDEIGALLHVHRATAARWVTKAREDVIAATRAALIARLQISPDELDSVVELIRSSIDVSLTRVLAASSA